MVALIYPLEGKTKRCTFENCISNWVSSQRMTQIPRDLALLPVQIVLRWFCCRNSQLIIAERDFSFPPPSPSVVAPKLISGNRWTWRANGWVIDCVFSPKPWAINVAVYLPGYLYAGLFVWVIERLTWADCCRKTPSSVCCCKAASIERSRETVSRTIVVSRSFFTRCRWNYLKWLCLLVSQSPIFPHDRHFFFLFPFPTWKLRGANFCK